MRLLPLRKKIYVYDDKKMVLRPMMFHFSNGASANDLDIQKDFHEIE